MNIICCVCAGAHHPWDCERARRFVTEASDLTVTPHDANERRRERERQQILDEAAVVLRAAVHVLDRADREEVRRACLEGKRRAMRRASAVPSR